LPKQHEISTAKTRCRIIQTPEEMTIDVSGFANVAAMPRKLRVEYPGAIYQRNPAPPL